ncbi:hypothetical protein K438DRAFT_1621452 [Mycena galopus ATCC 62051]|nr:hypothetical protein K438DRAFT_1621452 [Mycena galopus ATCC 62051]
MFSLNKTSILVKVNAQDFAAFTGTACDGIVGLDVACDGTCFDFTGRHSFEAKLILTLHLQITSQTDVSVTMYEGADCTGQDFPFGRESHGACIDVQTGTSVKSFKCVHV